MSPLERPIADRHLPDLSARLGELLATPAAIADLIERLIGLLDEIAPDPDRESDTDGEPSLGWTDAECQLAASRLTGDDDREGDRADDEPSDNGIADEEALRWYRAAGGEARDRTVHP